MKNYIGSYYNYIISQQSSFLVMFLEFIIGILFIIAMWKIFEKANTSGWIALVPFYNIYKLFKISMGNGWFFIILFLPIVNVIGVVLLAINLAKCFGKGFFYTLGLIFFTPIFMILLGFSDAQYMGPGGYGDFRPDEPFRNTGTGYGEYQKRAKPEDDLDFDDDEAKTVDFTTEKDD